MSKADQNERLYPWDDDLSPVLGRATNEDLDPLVEYILKASTTEELSTDSLYKRFSPNHAQYAPLIEREICQFGGNTIANIARGGIGPAYREIVCDVAKKLKADFGEKSSIDEIEMAILISIMGKAWEKMSDDEKQAFYKESGLDINVGKGIPKALPIAAIQAAIRVGGFASYQFAVIIANNIARMLLGRGLAFGANAALTRAIGIFAGPIGWVLTGGWALLDIASPGFRVTVPCVAHIAMLRLKYSVNRCQACGTSYATGACFCSKCGTKIEHPWPGPWDSAMPLPC